MNAGGGPIAVIMSNEDDYSRAVFLKEYRPENRSRVLRSATVLSQPGNVYDDPYTRANSLIDDPKRTRTDLDTRETKRELHTRTHFTTL